jgi:hypothetical protein
MLSSLHGPLLQVASIFIAMFLEALPFLLLGSLVASLVEEYVSPEWIAARFSGSPFKGVLLGLFAGMVVPTCECGVVPVVRRLIDKGVPPHAAVTYMIAAPVINPLVIASTLVAFRGDISMLLLRLGIVGVTAVYLGLVLSGIGKNTIMKKAPGASCGKNRFHNSTHIHFHDHGPSGHTTVGRTPAAIRVLSHAGAEFMEMGSYFLLGAGAASLIKTLLPGPVLAFFGSSILLAVPLMVILAVLLSVCSEADAFVAASFSGFPAASQLAFITVGPMVDLKLILMYRAVFQKKIVLLLIVVPIIFVTSLTLFLNIFLR